MSLQGEGSITFWLDHPDADWQTNTRPYKFGPMSSHGIEVTAFKNPDFTVAILISGPLSQTIMFHGPMPKVLRPDGVFVAITWRHPVVTLYVGPDKVDEFVLSETHRATLPICITSPTDTPSLDVVGDVLDNFSHVFNTVSGFLDATDPQVCITTITDGLDLSKFSVASSSTGSWQAFLNGTKSVFDFVRHRFGDFLAVCSGYGDRLAQAHVALKEADARIQHEKANQEKLATIAKANEIAREIGSHLTSHRQDISEEDKERLLNEHFYKPMQQLASTIVTNELRIEFQNSSDDRVA
ncbi:hypothetical protein CA51_10950 [Rosistilla oblonga]|uniref:hypothetical protein n=1 Tax=Rosistilla oblonga TaxID=2527990 RepID=UPI00118A502A|nr:hypothetical protein [Rosistilla oblonga]QDV11234.1 hypothetical protein CA51_10950 [Rosistilla oblonga]